MLEIECTFSEMWEPKLLVESDTSKNIYCCFAICKSVEFEGRTT